MQKEWDEFWLPFLDAKKLITKVDEMDGKPLVESICHSIFDPILLIMVRAAMLLLMKTYYQS